MNELPKKGDLIAGKYTVEGVLGQGGMGAVFEVCHRLTGKRFAVKWLLPALTGHSDAVRRFMREAQVAGRVDHPNVVQVYDVGQDGNSFYMVMELLQGEALAKRLDRVRRLGVEEACRIMLPVMHGLSVAHKAGVIHRDLKPDNVFLCKTPLGTEVSKVLDFGISKMQALAGEVTANVTKFGLVMGTPQYMSPEQLHGNPVDLRTDIYALGVMLYEILGGSVPYPGASFADLVLAVAHDDPKPLGALAPGLPPGILELVDRAMSRDPNLRYSSVEEMGMALASLSGGIAFAADTGDPSRTTNPRVTMQRSRSTPFATDFESVRPPTAAELGKPPTLPMIAGVGVAAAAVVALGAAAYMLMKPAAASQGPAVSPNTQVTPPGVPATDTNAATIPKTAPSDPHALDPILPNNGEAIEPQVPPGARNGMDPQAVENDPRWRALNGERVQPLDPTSLNPDTSDSQKIRLGSGHSSRSGFGAAVTHERSTRRGKSRAERRDDQDMPDPSAGRQDSNQSPSRFRGRGQGMTPDEF